MHHCKSAGISRKSRRSWFYNKCRDEIASSFTCAFANQVAQKIIVAAWVVICTVSSGISARTARLLTDPSSRSSHTEPVLTGRELASDSAVVFEVKNSRHCEAE